MNQQFQCQRCCCAQLCATSKASNESNAKVESVCRWVGSVFHEKKITMRWKNFDFWHQNFQLISSSNHDDLLVSTTFRSASSCGCHSWGDEKASIKAWFIDWCIHCNHLGWSLKWGCQRSWQANTVHLRIYGQNSTCYHYIENSRPMDRRAIPWSGKFRNELWLENFFT